MTPVDRQSKFARRTFLAAALGTAASAFTTPLHESLPTDSDRRRLLLALGVSAQPVTSLSQSARVRTQLAAAALHWPKLRTHVLADDPQEIRVRFARAIREDFATGRLVDIDGWQLPASEAVILALLANVV